MSAIEKFLKEMEDDWENRVRKADIQTMYDWTGATLYQLKQIVRRLEEQRNWFHDNCDHTISGNYDYLDDAIGVLSRSEK